MKRVLFVDDNANVLAGLKRTMHTMRREWDMHFIDDPEAALEAFRLNPFDIVVSDMRMPKMDGADLLAEIKKLAPESIRLILSGHSDSALVMKSVGYAHQYLSKPCEPTDLKRIIERTYALRELVGNKTIRQLISGLDNLPSLPSAYRDIVACLQDPDSSFGDVSKIVTQDIGMTTKILQLVNSAFFGLANPVASADQAVSYLGIDTVGALVLSHGIFSQFDDLDTGAFNIESLWRYSGTCASVAKTLAENENMCSQDIDEAFLGGMLHDVGKLVLASGMPDEYSEVLRRVGGQSQFSDEEETNVLGATHGQVGAYLIGLWGLPDSIVEAVAYHEIPSRGFSNDFGVLGAVHVASRLASNTACEDPTDPELRIDVNYLEKAGVADHWSGWQTACRELLATEEHAR